MKLQMFVALFVVAILAKGETFKLQKLPLDVYPQARCLDGSPGSYYFMPAPPNSKHPNTWVFYFKGGGWCVNNTNCLERSKTYLGSSKYNPEIHAGFPHGILSRAEDTNPALFDANVVYLQYCDGYSFLGSRDEPINVEGTLIYLRGSYIRKAILDHVLSTQPTLVNATEVLISGCSAGGLSTFLHSSSMEAWFREQLVHVTKIRAAPLSGFFLDAQNAVGQMSWGGQMQNWFSTANATADADSRCLQSLPPSLHTMCIFAEVVYARQTLPTFVFNSQLDLWQAYCILMGSFSDGRDFYMPHCLAYPKYKTCIESLDKTTKAINCTTDEFAPMYSYQMAFLDRVSSVKTFLAAGNGAFVPSCVTHCENQGRSWNITTINGVTAQQAFTRWWNNPVGGEPEVHLDCLMAKEPPFTCNPTCLPQNW